MRSLTKLKAQTQAGKELFQSFSALWHTTNSSIAHIQKCVELLNVCNRLLGFMSVRKKILKLTDSCLHLTDSCLQFTNSYLQFTGSCLQPQELISK